MVMVQWLGEIEAPAAPALAPSGPFSAGPAWDDLRQVALAAPGGVAVVSAGHAVRVWRREVEHAAVRLVLEHVPAQ